MSEEQAIVDRTIALAVATSARDQAAVACMKHELEHRVVIQFKTLESAEKYDELNMAWRNAESALAKLKEQSDGG